MLKVTALLISKLFHDYELMKSILREVIRPCMLRRYVKNYDGRPAQDGILHMLHFCVILTYVINNRKPLTRPAHPTSLSLPRQSAQALMGSIPQIFYPLTHMT